MTKGTLPGSGVRHLACRCWPKTWLPDGGEGVPPLAAVRAQRKRFQADWRGVGTSWRLHTEPRVIDKCAGLSMRSRAPARLPRHRSPHTSSNPRLPWAAGTAGVLLGASFSFARVRYLSGCGGGPDSGSGQRTRRAVRRLERVGLLSSMASSVGEECRDASCEAVGYRRYLVECGATLSQLLGLATPWLVRRETTACLTWLVQGEL